MRAALERRAAATPPAGAKSTQRGHLHILGNDAPSYPSGDTRTVVREAWGRNEIAYACISEVASSVVEGRISVEDAAGAEVLMHPSTELLERGAPSLGLNGYEVLELGVSWYLAAGNEMYEKVRSASGHVVELWPMEPWRCAIYPGSQRLIDHYTYRLFGKEWIVPPEDVVHIKAPNLLDEYWGMSPFRVAFRNLTSDNEATDLRTAWFQKRAVPGLAIITPEEVDEEDADRTRERFYSQFGRGAQNEAGVVVIDQATGIERLSFNMNELAMPDLTRVAETRICAVAGVPPVIIGSFAGLERSTFANYAEAREALWQETILPHQRKRARKFTADPDIGPGPGASIVFNVDDVDALSRVRLERAVQIREDYTAGIVTRDEARAERGFPPVGGKDGGFRVEPSPTVAIAGGRDAGGKGSSGGPPDDDPTAKGRAQREARGWARRQWKRAGAKSAETELLRFSVGLVAVADDALEAVKAAAVAFYEKAANDARDAFDATWAAAFKALPDDVRASLEQLRGRWEADLLADVWPAIEPIVAEAGKLTASRLGVAWSLDNETTRAFVESYRLKFSRAVSTTAKDRIQAVLLRAQDESRTVDTVRRDLEAEFASWSSSRAEMVARSETMRASNAGAHASYRDAGVTRVEWLASTAPCQFCENLDGKTIAIDGSFVPLGGQVEGAAGGTFRNDFAAVDFPPLHPHCVCTITEARNE